MTAALEFLFRHRGTFLILVAAPIAIGCIESSFSWVDTLVGWAWTPGADREPAPGTQVAFGALIKAWADSGAACPVGR